MPETESKTAHILASDRFVLGWVVGLLEGEGYFREGAVGVTSTDESTVATLTELLGGQYKATKIHRSNVKQPYKWRIIGGEAILLMVAVYPYLGPRRQLQVRDALLTSPLRNKYLINQLAQQAQSK